MMLRSVFLFMVCALAAIQPAQAAELVAPKDLKANWLDGRSVATTGPRGGKSEFSFKPDGKVVRTGGRAGSAGEGTWRLDEEGFCMKLGSAKRESCYIALSGADGSLRVIRRAGGAFVWTR